MTLLSSYNKADFIVQRVADLLNMPPDDIWQPGRYRRLVTARSLFINWGYDMEALAGFGNRIDSRQPSGVA